MITLLALFIFLKFAQPPSHIPDGDSYFNGNYVVHRYGSRYTGGPFDAVQLETPIEMRSGEGDEGRNRFGVAVARAITEFYRTYYGQ